MATVTTQNMAWSNMPTLAPVQLHYSYAAQPSHNHQQHSHPSSPHRSQHQPYYHPASSASALRGLRIWPYHSTNAHMRTQSHSMEGLYTSQQLPVKKRTRSKMYPSEEARQAAKMVQEARRREQNRNAQRRIRDRKEQHIFKLQGEVSALRRQGEEFRTEVSGLEEMIRRLLDQKSELVRKLGGMGVTVDLEMGRFPPILSDPNRLSLRKPTESFASNNALGLSSFSSSSSCEPR
ncbi:hypothetical protein NDA18_004718 [Ustilago nuda]|nr:hypothetical protein NDA18_004718 [Ustilago nuda]